MCFLRGVLITLQALSKHEVNLLLRLHANISGALKTHMLGSGKQVVVNAASVETRPAIYSPPAQNLHCIVQVSKQLALAVTFSR